MAAPTLLTDRLVLIPLGPADLDEVAALYADGEVMRYIASGVKTRAETADSLARAERTWKQQGWGLWAIRDATTGALVGEGGLQPLEGVEGAEVDFGYTFGRRHWGKGIATEAGEAMLADAWDRFDGPEIHSLVMPDNTASRGVLGKLGFTRAGTERIDGTVHEVWSIHRAGG